MGVYDFEIYLDPTKLSQNSINYARAGLELYNLNILSVNSYLIGDHKEEEELVRKLWWCYFTEK